MLSLRSPMRLIMLALLLLCSLTGVFAQTSSCGTVPSGWVCTVFTPNGTSILAMDLPTYLQTWQQMVMNQSILSLDNQGDNSPTALSNEAAAVANTFCSALVYTPVPGCASASTIAAAVTPIQQTLMMAANLVPASQWNTATYNPQAASNLNTAVQLAQVPPPPPPPQGPLVLLPCANVAGVTMCYPGAGVTAVTASGFSYLGNAYQNGATVEYLNVFYVAHTSQGLIGAQIWFSLGPAATAAQ